MEARTIDLAAAQVPPEFIDAIPLRFAREHVVVAVEIRVEGGDRIVTLVTAHADRHWVTDRIAYQLDAVPEVVVAPEAPLVELISRAYHQQSSDIAAVAGEIDADESAMPQVHLTEDVLEIDDKAPAVKLVNATLLQAVRQRASDIHIDPGEKSLRVRFRIDGVLYDRATLNPEVRDSVVSRIKVMARMDIAERRLPQDGGLTVCIGERRIDLRIATLPSQYGERVVIRLLDKQSGLMDLDRLGLSSENRSKINHLLELSHGIVLLAGPTGSGKTTTLYAMLTALNAGSLNILTLEDPIEYQLPGICQTQVNEKKGLTFARGLRSLVRQDPDVIMVGEIRDLETAQVAIQSALTGHLVFSTLHTNDAPSSVTRLLDLGVEPYLVASSVNACIAQRLVRRICPECKQERTIGEISNELSPEDRDFLQKYAVKSVPVAKGCASCFATGFAGRTGIYEFLLLTDGLRDLVNARTPSGQLRNLAIQQGLITLRKDGLLKVAAGMTTVAEVRSVTQLDSI